MLGLDGYEAYCLDEAGAYLIAQKDPPAYPDERPARVMDRAMIEEMTRLGAATMR